MQVLEQSVCLSYQDTESVQAMLDTLPSKDIQKVVSWLSLQSFQEVQATLKNRSRLMAKHKACIAGGAGYILSAVALVSDILSGFQAKSQFQT